MVQGKGKRVMAFDLLNHPHPHPLFFNEEGKHDGQLVSCSKCHQPLRPPAFSCSECNFHIHQSCIDHYPQIHSRFHPQHPLHRKTNNYLCSTCWQMPSGEVYACQQCGFQIDIKCAIADTKASGLRRTAANEFRHFSHPHPLTFQEEQGRGTKDVVCVVCELLITSVSSYACSHCGDHFHQQCAELPRELQNPDYHQHPLFLLPHVSRTDTLCNSCKNDCREFIYNCPQCDFNLHVACLKSLNHEHTFTKFRNHIGFVCRACGKEDQSGFSWFCTTCHILVHKQCAELPLTLRTFGHRGHDLSLTYFRKRGDIIRDKIHCKICGEKMETKYAGYGCYECNYFAHLDCSRRQRLNPTAAMDALDSNAEYEISGTETPHFIHHHNLTLFPHEELAADRVCDGCMKRLSGPSYGCAQCDFFLHERCLKLPRNKTVIFHEHELTLISIPDFAFQCKACLQHFHGLAYRCKDKHCLSTFDIRCTSIKTPFEHPSHEHPLSLYRTNEEQNCEACGKGVKDKVSFQCISCNFHLDAGCATLPLAVRYRFDAHPLNLTFVEEEERDEYCCDICEEERDPWVWYYSCKTCSYAAHVGCALGEFPYVKSKMHEAHSHPLSLAMKGNEKGGRGCGGCGESCAGNLAFECGACKFNVHAIGPCYQQQVVQEKLHFTSRCFYSRAIGLHQHPIQKLFRVTVGPYGGKGGSPWKENVFSTIRSFVVYHDAWVYSIQIHYEKHGELVSSAKHGGDGGQRSEVAFDYPDECLVSIHGYYGNFRTRTGYLTVIRSLSMETNVRIYGPFGVENGTKFSIPTAGLKIIGIHGRSGSFLDAIGVHALSTQE